MMFSADKNKPKNTQDTEGSEHPDDEGKENENNSTGNVDNAETSNAERNIVVPGIPSIKQFTSRNKPIKKRKLSSTYATNDPIIDEAINLLRAIQSKKNDKDEYALYGEQVAIKLRNLTSPQARFRVQQIINNALFGAEMECFSYTSQPIFHRQTTFQSPLSSYPSSHSPSLTSPHSPSSAQPYTTRSQNVITEHEFDE